ncbi:hypothetical protein SCHPADRAFT_991731 [Schizopora paradoxa]|uniref:F-box domain-containing protein n=1 Tax=Schizopora paradoxa TaxID=27342 RepID=A0A0H2S7V3_9AGAM|nr:hypothetical protein SCHPADRAFT_991731 [Schizopora paradoxa]
MDLPEIVMEDIADIFNRMSWQAIFAYNTIVTTDKPIELRNESQDWTSTLLAMSLVRRSWTNAAQRVMRRRVKLHSYSRLQKFSEQNLAGTHVRCLSYVYTPQSGLGGDDVAPETHWKLLADVLSQCPNIRQLSMKSIFRFLSRETDYKYWSRDHNTDGLPLVFSSIGALPNIAAWVFDVDLRVTGRINLLSHLCGALPNLRRLRYLQAVIWREDPKYNHHDELSLPDRSPPPSLKTLVLHVASPYVPVRYMKWLLRSCGEYRPDELTFHRPHWPPEHEVVFRSRLRASRKEGSFESAQQAQFICELDYIRGSSRPTSLFITPIVDLCSSLRNIEIYLRFTERSLEFPRTAARNSIESLTVNIGHYVPLVAQTVDRVLSPRINRQTFPNLRQFRIRGANSRFPSDEPKEGFPRLLQACVDAEVTFVIDFEAKSTKDLYVPLYIP